MTTSSIFLVAGIIVLALVLIVLIIFFVKKRGLASSSESADFINEQIYVGNLPYHVSEDELRNYFSKFGSAKSIRVIRNFKTGRSKGYAFVTYATSNEAQAALLAHGKDMQGRSMVVRIAKPRQE